MNILKTLTIFLMALTGFQIAAMQQPNLRQQLIDAALKNNVERVEQLMLEGVPVDPHALFFSIVNGNYDIAKTIFECGVNPEVPADPNQRIDRSTLFMHLVLNRNLQPEVKEKLIRLYLKYGADLELRDAQGNTPLHCVLNLDFTLLKLLLEQGADANAQDNGGITVLMKCVTSIRLFPKKTESEKMRDDEFISKVKLLLSNGADVNLKDDMGQTCLLWAVYKRNKTLVQLLLENGANVYLKTTTGESALDYAEDQPEILKLLKDAQKTKSESSYCS